MKTVIYQQGMEELADELSLTGYRTVCINHVDKNDTAEAILVDRKSFSRALSTEAYSLDHRGALLIDVTDTDIATIKKILVKRSYHALFE